jgi:hypothetical protein
MFQGTLISRKSNLAGKSTYKRVQCIRDCFMIIGCLALPKLKWLHWATMIWSGWIKLGGFGVLVIGILLLIWSLSRGNVSAFGLVALLTAGFSSPATGRVHRIGTHFSPLFCARHRTHAFLRSIILFRSVCCEDTNQKSNQFVKQTAHKVGTPTRRQQTARQRAKLFTSGAEAAVQAFL